MPLKTVVIFISLCAATAAWAQYQTDPTHLFPAASNSSPSKKAPPKNTVISTTDKQKTGIPLHRADKFYPINQSKPIAITSNRRVSKPVTVWKNAKKPSYHSLYQDPSQ